MPLGCLGYEWDEDTANGFRPAGLFDLSSTTSTTAEIFVDYGSTTMTGQKATHHLTLYRALSGALVFGAGTVQWAWGLDNTTTGGSTDRNMQQATVNLFADMGAQPATLMSGLVAATRSTDTTAPTSSITSPAAGANLTDGTAVTISGTASDIGGVVAGVEVSTDGGTTWHPANGTTSWSYTWAAHGNPSTTIRSRAVDDSGNLETPSTGTSVNVACPCSIWGSGTAPAVVDSGDASSVELGVKFTSDVAGSISGIRFYKASTNTGTHIGNLWSASATHIGTLWSSSGTALATATFSGETASGWKQVTFANPVAITAGTTYVASYLAPVGHYSSTSAAFASSGVDAPPLHALANSIHPNGVYVYSSSNAFPTSSYNATNYWVDLVFTQAAATAPGAPTNVVASAGNGSATVSWTAPSNGGSTITSYTLTPYIGTNPQAATTISGSPPATSVTITGLTNGTTYTFKVSATNAIGTGPASAPSNAVTPATVPSAPTNVIAIAGNGSATVSWTAPSNGGSPITSYTITPYVGTTAKASTTISGSPPATSVTITGLTNGTTYTFKVSATNAIGTGPQSAASNAVKPCGLICL